MHPIMNDAPSMTLRCPKCTAEMTTYERNGVHVDQCRECRGVFLDRGELERLMDLEAEAAASARWRDPLRAGQGEDGRGGAWGDPRTEGRRPRPDARATRGGWDDRRDDDDDDDDEWRARDDGRSWRSRDDDHDRTGARGRSRRRGFLGELFEGFGD